MNSEDLSIEESLSNLSISEKEKSSKTKLEVDLYEYTIISKYFGDEADSNQLIYLPTPESLSRLISVNILQGMVKFDLNKYKSLFKVENLSQCAGENEENELASSF